MTRTRQTPNRPPSNHNNKLLLKRPRHLLFCWHELKPTSSVHSAYFSAAYIPISGLHQNDFVRVLMDYPDNKNTCREWIYVLHHTFDLKVRTKVNICCVYTIQLTFSFGYCICKNRIVAIMNINRLYMNKVKYILIVLLLGGRKRISAVLGMRFAINCLWFTVVLVAINARAVK